MQGYNPSTGLGFVQNGDYVEVTLPYDRNPGEGVLVGSLFGICVEGGVQGAVVNIHRKGLYGLPAASGASTDAVQGALAYWDNTNKRITPVATNNTLVAKFWQPKTTSQATARVILG
jgi:predicted RecA/RadA family phage recombinase